MYVSGIEEYVLSPVNNPSGYKPPVWSVGLGHKVGSVSISILECPLGVLTP